MTLEERLRALLAVAEFRDVPVEDRAVLAAAMREESFATGETVIAAGDRADRVFVLCDGVLEVTPEGRAARRLERGALLGELAFFADEVRTATVRAASDCVLLSLPFVNFRAFLLGHPAVTLILAGRLVRALRILEADLAAARGGRSG